MDDLIEALTIFRRYANLEFPTTCEDRGFWVLVSPELVSQKDTDRLEELSFIADDEDFVSYRFGIR